MRMIKALPEVKEKIVSGDLSLSVVAQAQSFFKKKEKASHSLSKESKLNLLKTLENNSSRDCERTLLELAPETRRGDKIRAVTAELTELRLMVDCDFMKKIERLKNLLSHSHANLSVQEILKLALDQPLIKKDPLLKVRGKAKVDQAMADDTSIEMTQISNGQTEPPLPTSKVKDSRSISAETKRTVWSRSDSQCSYRSSITGKTCDSKKFLEIDHRIPISKGGPTQVDNLQLLCDQHNRRKGDQI